jgi:YegS/Rv2252/BmrU family lipid kinase
MTKNNKLQTHKIALIVNGKSHKGRQLYREAKKKIQAAGINLALSFCVKNPDRLHETVRNSLAEGVDMIIVGGGDGTISSVVDFGANKDIVFAILPVGTANSFALSLGLPIDLDQAIEVIRQAKITQVDMGKINGDYFANTANIGISVAINQAVNPNHKKYFGRIAFIPGAIKQLFTFQPFDVTITSQSRVTKHKCIEMLIANGQFQGGLALALNTDLENGKLLIKIFLCNNWKDKVNLLGYWFLSIFRHNIRNKRIKQYKFDSLTIETSPPMYIDIDGEAVTKTPIDVSVAKASLKIIVP